MSKFVEFRCYKIRGRSICLVYIYEKAYLNTRAHTKSACTSEELVIECCASVILVCVFNYGPWLRRTPVVWCIPKVEPYQ